MVLGRYLWGFLPILTLLLVLMGTAYLATDSADAANVDIFSDWTISDETLVYSNDTIHVRGNVTVGDLGALTLDNCTLIVNSTTWPLTRLTVTKEGQLHAINSRLMGSPDKMEVFLYGDCSFDWCTIMSISGAWRRDGIRIMDGTTTFRNSKITQCESVGFDVKGNLTLDNVTINETKGSLLFGRINMVSRDITISVRNCIFDGDWSGADEDRMGVEILGTSGGGFQTNLEIKNSTFTSFYTAIYHRGTGDMNISITNCSVQNSTTGIFIEKARGLLRLRNLHLLGPGGFSGRGLSLGIQNETVPDISDLTIKQCNRPILIWIEHSGGDAYVRINNTTLEDGYDGIRIRGYSESSQLTVDVHNFTLINITFAFAPSGYSKMNVYDTPHKYADYSGGWLRVYTRLVLSEARWFGGGAISTGDLVVEDEKGIELGRFDLADPQSLVFLEGERSATVYFTRWELSMHIDIGGHTFWSEPYEIWNETFSIVEVIDHVFPEVQITNPDELEGFSDSFVTFSGVYSEAGSGMDAIEYSLDGGPFERSTSFDQGSWSFDMIIFPDGTHELTVRAWDVVGNVGNASTVTFIVDVISTPLNLSQPLPELINITMLEVGGVVDPDATLTLNGMPIVVNELGGFLTSVSLYEGSNMLTFSVRDLLGNIVNIGYNVTLDTVPPSLAITSPLDEAWVNISSILIEGTVEIGSELWVDGVAVESIGGAFERQLSVIKGVNLFHITARDDAGNWARRTLTIHGDMTPPVIQIEVPDSLKLFTSSSDFVITGTVDEPNLLALTINDEQLGIFADSFTDRFTLVEGMTTFVVQGVDKAGNMATVIIEVVYDITPPVYTVDLSIDDGELLTIDDGLYTKGSRVTVVVSSTELTTLTFDDVPSTEPSLEHELSLDLEEGVNNIQFSIFDMVGNAGKVYRQTVTVDTVPPEIILSSPDDGSIETERSVLIIGRTEFGAILSIDGAPVQLSPSGTFSVEFELEKGTNTIIFKVKDQMNNVNVTSIVVTYQVPPSDGDGGISSWIIALVGIIIAVCLITFVMYRRK